MADRTLKRKKTARGGKVGDLGTLKKPDKPRCKIHRHEMIFDSDRMLWACPDRGCKMVAHPPNDVGGPQPISFKGPFSVYYVHDENTDEEKYLIQCNKVYFDITDIVTQFYVDPDRTGVDRLIIETSMIKLDQDGNMKS